MPMPLAILKGPLVPTYFRCCLFAFLPSLKLEDLTWVDNQKATPRIGPTARPLIYMTYYWELYIACALAAMQKSF